MLRHWVVVCCVLGWALALRANDETDFSGVGTNATGTNWDGTDGWTNAFAAKKCKARLNGVGMAPPGKEGSGRSGMTRVFEPAERMISVSVTCVASGKGAAEAKAHLLGLRLNDGEILTQALSFGGTMDAPVTVEFVFEEPTEVGRITLTNETPSGTTLFEVRSVAWRKTLSAISADISAPARVASGRDFSCSLRNCSGGTGTYVRVAFTFAGETLELGELSATATFTAPAVDGSYSLTLTVEDSAGTVGVFVHKVCVTPYVAPRELRVTELLRTSFGLAWELGSALSPQTYRVSTVGVPAVESVALTLTPVWVATEGGYCMEAPQDLTRWTQGSAVDVFYVRVAQWEGTFEMSLDDGATWTTLRSVAGRFLGGSIPAGAGQQLQFRASGTAFPRYLQLTLSVRRSYTERTVAAQGGLRSCSVTGLPAGRKVQVRVASVFCKDDGQEVPVTSESIEVSLPPMPPFAAVRTVDRVSCLELDWPQDGSIVSGEMLIHAERSVPHDLPEGLYLSRVYFTKSDTATGMPAGKAVVISNTSSAPVALNGAYALVSSKPRDPTEADPSTESVYTWDFKVGTAGGAEAYPYVVPAGGELIFAHGRYLPLEMRAGVVTNTTSALNFTADGYTLTLRHGDTVINSLRPSADATVRLWEDDLAHTDTHPVCVTDIALPAFYTPWSQLTEDHILDRVALTPEVRQFYYARYLGDLERVRRIWVECFVTDGLSRSEPSVVELWTSVRRPGYRLRLR